MEKKLDYFTIDGETGGNQDWFTNIVMHMGGCAAATACDCSIYFALHRGMEHLYPYDVRNLTKEEYIKFSMKMKPYLRPRTHGVNKPSLFIEGYSQYLRDIDESAITMAGFEGTHSAKEAAHFIKSQIDAGYPVPYLMLRHKNEIYKDFVWHWFLCFGYKETQGDMLVTVATYGEETTFSLNDLWNTGCEEKGGLVQLTMQPNQRDGCSWLRQNTEI